MKKMALMIVSILSLLTIQLKAQDIEVKSELDDKGEYNFKAINHSLRPYFIVMDFIGLVGTCSDAPGSVHLVIPGEQQLCTVKPNQRYSPFSSYSYRYFKTNPLAKVDPDYPYLIPLKNGTSTEVFQVTNISTVIGKKAPPTWYCVGFNTNPGDTIYASRGGIVVENKTSIEEKNRDFWYSRDYNYVIILQDDGTVARYSQLENDQVFPKIGDRIIPSQPIGIVFPGNSQNRSHVYFLVYHENLKSNEQDFAHTKFCVSSVTPEILLPDNKYVAKHFPEVITKEMSRKMKKKYLGE